MTHVKPDVRGSWDVHAVKVWYTGPAMHHYRCYRVWVWEMMDEYIADTLA